MMQQYSGLVLIVGIVLLSGCQAGDEDEAKEMIMNLSADCREQTGTTESDVDDMMAKIKPSTPEGWGLIACMYKMLEIVTPDNKLNKEGFVELTKMISDNDDEKVKMAGEIADACAAVEDEDERAYAEKLTECIESESKSRGIE